MVSVTKVAGSWTKLDGHSNCRALVPSAVGGSGGGGRRCITLKAFHALRLNPCRLITSLSVAKVPKRLFVSATERKSVAASTCCNIAASAASGSSASEVMAIETVQKRRRQVQSSSAASPSALWAGMNTTLSCNHPR